MPKLRAGFTTRARCLVAGGLTAIVCGLFFGETDLVRAGCLVAAIPIVAALVVSRSQVTIASRRSTTLARATVGQDAGIALTITNRSALPTGAIMLEDRLPESLSGRARFAIDGLGRRESRTIAYRIPALGRGRYVTGPLRVRLTDPFGLIDTSRSFTATSTLLITPVAERLPGVTLPTSLDLGDNAGSHSIGNHGADDASTREYRYGDDLRKIHWRSTARVGSLMVRHEERPWQGTTTLVLDTRAAAHESYPAGPGLPTDPRQRGSLEWAISAIASVGHELFLARREVGLICQPVPASGRVALAGPGHLQDFLAELDETRDAELGPLSTAVRAAARESTVLAVLGRLDEASAHALAEAHARGSSVPAYAIVLDTATWRDPGSPVGLADPAIQATVIRTLRAAGWSVVTAGAADSIPATWQRLLSQRSLGAGAESGVGVAWQAGR